MPNLLKIDPVKTWEELENRKSLQTDGQTDDGRQAIRKAHLSRRRRWAKNKRKFYLWIHWNESWIQKWVCLKTDRYFDLYPIMWNVFYLQHHKVESKLKRMGLNHHNMSQFFIFILNVFLYKKRLVYASPHAPSFAPSFSTPMYHICIYLLYKDICN